jgi:carbonic anhydrase
VLAIFLEPVHEPDFFDNEAFRTIAHNLPLRYQDKAVLINLPLNLRSLLPHSGETFYRYLGSLTTPGCNEEVEWTVVPEPVQISIGNYKKFHDVKDENGEQLGQNYRPVQALGNRRIQVYRSI